MSIKSLSLLVLAVLIGTALSVRWYLAADSSVAEAREEVRQELREESPYGRHAPIWMRAEPVHGRQDRAALRGSGVARGRRSAASRVSTSVRGPIGIPVEAVLNGSTPAAGTTGQVRRAGGSS